VFEHAAELELPTRHHGMPGRMRQVHLYVSGSLLRWSPTSAERRTRPRRSRATAGRPGSRSEPGGCACRKRQRAL